MKKSLLLVGLMALALTACKVGEKPAEKNLLKQLQLLLLLLQLKTLLLLLLKMLLLMLKTLPKTQLLPLKTQPKTLLALLKTPLLLPKTLPRNNSCSAKKADLRIGFFLVPKRSLPTVRFQRVSSSRILLPV